MRITFMQQQEKEKKKTKIGLNVLGLLVYAGFLLFINGDS